MCKNKHTTRAISENEKKITASESVISVPEEEHAPAAGTVEDETPGIHVYGRLSQIGEILR